MFDRKLFYVYKQNKAKGLPKKISRYACSWFLALLVLLALIACSTMQSQSQFKVAVQQDSIPTYKLFLEKFPESKEAPWVRTRIQKLEENFAKKRVTELRKLKEWNLLRIEMIKQYSKKNTDIITEKEFFSDGWNPRDPFYGRLGIMGMNKAGTVTEYEIGAIVVPEDTRDSLANFAANWFDYYREAQKNLTWKAVQQKDDSFDVYSHKFCAISFKNKQLNSIEWSEEFLNTKQ